MSLRVRIFFCLQFSFASLALAEDHTVRIQGKVTDPSGAAVHHAIVRLYSRDTSEALSAFSDDQGSFEVTLPRGEFLIRAEAPGLRLPKSLERVVIDGVENPKALSLQLAIAEVSSSVAVTATGTPQSLDETAKAVDILDRGELDRRGVESIVDGLRGIPGIRVVQRGGPGSLATIQIRGLRTFDTAVLLDGMRFRDVGATQGDAQAYLGDLLLVDSGRVEVLQGAGSSLYGTNATAGVVNIVTDSGIGPFHGAFTADGGGLGEFRGLARFGGGALHNRAHYSAGAGHLNVTRGVDTNDRYRNTTGNGLVDYSLRPGMILRGQFLATDAFLQLNQTPNAAPAAVLPASGRIRAVAPDNSQVLLAGQGLPYSLGSATFIPALDDADYYRTSRIFSTQVALQQQVAAPFSYRLTYQALRTYRNIVDGPLGAGFQPLFRSANQYEGHTDTLQGRANLSAGPHHLLTMGYEWEREYFDSPSYDENPDPAQRVNSRTQVSERSHSFDLQDQIRLFHDRMQVSLSGRLQRFDLSTPRFLGTAPVYASVAALNPPNAYTGDVSVAYFIRGSGTKIRSHAGNGYREPSLYERFGTFFSGAFFSAYGDPRLRPERSIGIDAGVDQYLASDRLRLSATYFYTRLQEVIGFDFSGLINPATDAFGRSLGYLNTSGGLARGVELASEARPWKSTTLKVSYAYTNARDRASQFADGTLDTPRISPHTFNFVLMQQVGTHWDAAFDLVAASDYLFPLNRRTFVFPGARQAGLTVGFTQSVSEGLRLRTYTTIKNLGGQTYYEDGFRTPGRWAVAGMVLSF